MRTRRGVLAAGVPLVLGSAGCTQPDRAGTRTDPESTEAPTSSDVTVETTGTTPTDVGNLQVGLETVTDVPETPVAFRTTPDGGSYIADRPGRVYLRPGGSTEAALDLTDSVMTGSERGLLGLSLHPEFASNGRLYARYSSRPRAGTPSGYSHTFVLAEFSTREDGTIDAASERTLLEIPQPQGNHNSGPVAFGPDGYLYVGVGDGGAGGDAGTGHVEDWYGPNDGGNGQDVTENLLGSILRIDVDDRSDGLPYGVPDDNPLVGREGLDEQYAWGLRNPWGRSFDGGDLYVADVGQNRFEEVNLVEMGGNYGWNVKEGTHCYGAESCPGTTPDGEPLRDPVIEYPHGDADVSGVAVVGGHVYRGDAVSGLSGHYVFGDLNADGRLFVAEPADEGLWPTTVLEIEGESRDALGRLLGLSRDREGELYALTPGGVHRIVPVE
ncbi:MAG: PQQ-dependent sugar dehydrogenase [Haloferacaceae archaeon]